MDPAKPNFEVMTVDNTMWREIRDAKKVEQRRRIPSEWLLQGALLDEAEAAVDKRDYAARSGILTAEELDITGRDATHLVAAMADGTLTAEKVVTAFCKRCAIGQQLCNYLTEVMFCEAIEEARKLDNHFRETGQVKGPLHGLPMTVKECFNVKGFASSNNYVSRAFHIAEHDSYLVEILKNVGAVIIAKTNTPQTMMCADTNNNLFGLTKNPVVSHLTAGGSSGGEGSVVAFRGCALGIGTDVGGSIRIPAAAQGVYGFKPSSGLLPMLGSEPSTWAGTNTGVPAVCGPLANSLRDMELLVKTVRASAPWMVDPTTIPYIYETVTPARRPVIGVIRQSGLTLHPPVRRAIEEAVTCLQAAGFEVREFVPPDFAIIKKITAELFTLDGLSYARQELSRTGEPVLASIVKLGLWQRSAKTPEEMWKWNAQKAAYQRQMHAAWTAAGIDIALCPAGPHSAVAPGDWSNTMYTVCWNGVDYPAAIIPFSKVDPAVDQPDETFKPLDSFDVQGAPVALQLIGMKWKDADLLRDVEAIDKVLRM
ncbi:hypothetical protein Sste5346_004881 [Sporothrix stenoceras]|uniref:amidase n=1 Tax=Sporothrix stenoceras TaxID=5173 RepID=A0ABR3Z695_9PEZI